MAHRYEVNSGPNCFLPGGFSCEESISAYYENEHGYHLMVTRMVDGKMSFTSDFPRETGEAYASLAEAKGSESYKGFVALVKRMNRYRREALAAFADPANARRKVNLEDVFAAMGEIAESIHADAEKARRHHPSAGKKMANRPRHAARK